VKISHLSPGTLVRDGTNLMKVSHVYRDKYATAQVVLVGKRIPRLSRIKHYTVKSIERELQEPTPDQLKDYRSQC
jgi:hypothetical protein